MDSKEHLFVVGRHRGEHRRGYIRIVIPRAHLTNFRVRGIYEPSIVEVATAFFDGLGAPLKLWESEEVATRCAEWWQRDATKACHD